jgi:hypothetical protein
MKIYVDIDETICFYENIRNYSLASPIYGNIEKINKLYDQGHEITYWTARGSIHTHRIMEYYNLTERQLEEWGCKYHKLIVGEKPAYDLLICDKTKRIEEV